MTQADTFTVWAVQYWPSGPQWERRPDDTAPGERWPDAHRALLRRFNTLADAIAHCHQGAREVASAFNAPSDAWWGIQHNGVIACNVVYNSFGYDRLAPQTWDIEHWLVYGVGEYEDRSWSGTEEPLVIFAPRWASANWQWILNWREAIGTARFAPGYQYSDALSQIYGDRDHSVYAVDDLYWCSRPDHQRRTREPMGSEGVRATTVDTSVEALAPDPDHSGPEPKPDEAARARYDALEAEYEGLTAALERIRQDGCGFNLVEHVWIVADTKLRWLKAVGCEAAFVASDRDAPPSDDLDEARIQLESAYLEGLNELRSVDGVGGYALFLDNADAMQLTGWLETYTGAGESARAKADAYRRRRDAIEAELDAVWELMESNYVP